MSTIMHERMTLTIGRKVQDVCAECTTWQRIAYWGRDHEPAAFDRVEFCTYCGTDRDHERGGYCMTCGESANREGDNWASPAGDDYDPNDWH